MATISVTLADLRAEVRELADMETTSASSAFVDNDELDDRINDAGRQLYDKLCIAAGDEYFATSTTATTVADQATYTWATSFSVDDHYRTVRVQAHDGTVWYDLPRWEFADYAALRTQENTGSVSLESYHYRPVSTGIEIRPAPTGTSHTIVVHYIAQYADLLSESDELITALKPWRKWLALTAAIALLAKEESDPSALMAERQVVEQHMLKMLSTQDEARPARVQDTRKDDATWWSYGGGWSR